MIKKYTLFVIIFILMIYMPKYYCIESYDDTISFIRDFLLHKSESYNFIGILCWKQGYALKFAKTLFANGFFINIMFDCNESRLYFPGHQNLYIIDMSCPFSEACLKRADGLKLFKTPQKWMILDRNINDQFTSVYVIGENTTSNNISSKIKSIGCSVDDRKTITTCPQYHFADKTVLADSSVIVAFKNIKTGIINLTEYYKNRIDSELISENYGHWSKDQGIIDKRSNNISSIRRQNVKGTQLTACFVITNNDTLDHLTDYRDKHIDTLTKVNYRLTNYMIDFLNGSRKFTHENDWGHKGADGKWTGMIGQVVHDNVDIGGTPLFFLANRAEVIEYIAMTTPTIAKFVFRQPPLSYVRNIFLLPFRWTVWAAVGSLVMLACISLYFTANWEEKHSNVEYKIQNNIDQSDEIKTDLGVPHRWGDVFLLAMGAVAQQGSAMELRSLAGRITTMLLFTALMFLYTSYSANIVALLQSQSNNIKTLDDLLHSRLKLGADDTVYNRFYFPRYTDPARRGIWVKKMAPKGSRGPQFFPLQKGVEKLQKGLFAFHMEVGVGYKVVVDTFHEDEKCGLQEIQYFEVINPWFAVQKYSSFGEMFKVGIRRIHETGIQSREMKKLYTDKPACTSKGGRFVSVGLIEVGPALIWLGIGLSLALILLIFEKLYKIRSIYIMKQCNAYDEKY